MLKTTCSLFAILMFANSSFAAPIKANSPARNAVQALEAALGQPLSAEQKQGLKKAAAEARASKQITDVSFGGGSNRGMFCVGAQAAAVGARLSAACIDFLTFNTYSLDFLGIGYSLQLTASIFDVRVSADEPQRYDDSFDPIPGDYGGLGGGYTPALLGYSSIIGTSGNKIIHISSLNFGIGGDLFSGGWIHIEKN